MIVVIVWAIGSALQKSTYPGGRLVPPIVEEIMKAAEWLAGRELNLP